MSNFISNELSNKTSLRYDFLFEEGLKFAQKYSGDKWTDYNYHDPGVTFLEYLCYALTDLGYRSNFPIQDLFLFGKEDFDSVKENLLFSPIQALTTSPVTLKDYRKLIIDHVKKVGNAWITPVYNNNRGIKGLFEIFIESSEDLSDFEIKFLKREVENVFHSNRLIGHDLENVHVLKKVNLSIEAVVSIESDALGELVMAKMYAAIDQYLNPPIDFHDPFKLWKEQNYPPELVFSGPTPKFGFIFDKDLKPKVEAIYLSRIKEIILSVEGVKEIRDVRLYKNSLPVFESFVHFDHAEYPSIRYLDEITEMFDSKVKILKNNSEYQVDPIITKQLISTEILAGNRFYHKEIIYQEFLPEGKFDFDELTRHFSIHNELPDLFGVGFKGLSKNASNEMKASALQVSTYLYFFEQIMASYLAQLANLRLLFSVKNLDNTYFDQLPNDIPLLDQFIQDKENFILQLKEFSKNQGRFFDRKNRLLDHLLARFGERIDEVNLKKLSPDFGKHAAEEAQAKVLETKINFLDAVVDLGKNKSKAFNLKSDVYWDTDNISGLEKRIALSLNIKNLNRRFLTAAFLERAKLSLPTKEMFWELTTIASEAGKLKVWKLPSEHYKDTQAHFYGKGKKFVNYLFESIYNDKTIYRLTSQDGNVYYLLMKQKDVDVPFVLYQSEVEEECLQVKGKIENSLRNIDQQSEGFHLIEHILLRPLEPVSYIFSFLNEKGEVFIEGIFSSDLESQKILGEDIIGLGLDEENYSIVEEEGTTDILVFLYNSGHEPIARIKRSFSSKPGAKKAIESAMKYFQKILSKTLDLDAVLEINHIAGAGHGIPSDFSFSETLSFIFPNWPNRFQKSDFKKLLKDLIRENIMAHHAVKVYFLDLQAMARFEEIYQQWLMAKSEYKPDLGKTDALSLQLIQLLMDNKPEF